MSLLFSFLLLQVVEVLNKNDIRFKALKTDLWTIPWDNGREDKSVG